MFHVVVFICLLATPEKCSETPVPDSSIEGIIACLKQAGDKADAWQKDNSKYFVVGWRCEKVDKDK